MKKESTGKKIGRVLGRIAAILFGSLAVIFAGLYTTMWIFCHGPSEAARDLFVSTMLETGALKFVVGWYYDTDEVLAITGNNNMVHSDAEVDTGLITVGGSTGEGEATASSSAYPYEDDLEFDENGIAIVELAGRSYYAKLMIVKDPSRVSVATIYPWSDDKSGSTLDVLVASAGAIAGVNGGEYVSDNNWGGRPKGLVVSNGQIQYNSPQWGDVMVGFNEDDILVIRDTGSMSADQVSTMVSEERIRDAVSFKDVDDGDVNHFTKLIINGEAIQLNGSGSGANPRTAIGQRADGAVLLLVTDGRGASGHLGATAADLISIMQQYGVVNAANVDGGSSSSMVYNGVFEMTSVTMYFANSSWNLPDAFVVK